MTQGMKFGDSNDVQTDYNIRLVTIVKHPCKFSLVWHQVRSLVLPVGIKVIAIIIVCKSNLLINLSLIYTKLSTI